MVEWLKAHKAVFGGVLTALAAGLYAYPAPWAQTAYHYLVILGPVLISAGLLPSDAHVQASQEFVKAGGVELREK